MDGNRAPEWFAEPRILAEEELRRLEAQKAPDEWHEGWWIWQSPVPKSAEVAVQAALWKQDIGAYYLARRDSSLFLPLDRSQRYP